jgi:hypothetical protein
MMTRRVDPVRARPAADIRHLQRAIAGVVLLAWAVSGCAATGSLADSPPDPETAARLEAATAPAHRLEVVFDWNVQDREARLSGRGVLRLDRGERARVDLFGVRGETLAAAVVEGERMRVVPSVAASLLPPPALLWSTLGAFRQPDDAPLAGTRVADGEVLLEYARDGTRWIFRFDDDVLRSTEWTAPSGRRTVVLTGSAGYGLPRQAAFRDWTEFRELNLSVTDIQERTAFDADAWILPGER